MRLDDLRREEIGMVKAWIPKYPGDEEPASFVPVSFHEIVTQACYTTWQPLGDLEKVQGAFYLPRSGFMPVALWFLAIEAYINTILKIFCKVLNKEFSEYRSKKLMDRFRAVIEFAGTEPVDLQKTGLWNRVNEFCQFRNEIFHDRFVSGPLNFRYTAFTDNPHQSNQVDNVQAAQIATEVFQLLRYVVPGLDVMPCVYVAASDAFGWPKADYTRRTDARAAHSRIRTQAR